MVLRDTGEAARAARLLPPSLRATRLLRRQRCRQITAAVPFYLLAVTIAASAAMQENTRRYACYVAAHMLCC